MAKYLKIATTGEMVVVDLGNKFAGLQELYQATSSDIVQMVQLDDLTMWVDEEGKFNGKEQNELATKMFWDVFGPYDVIMGDALITGDEDADGNLLGFTDDQIDIIKQLALS